MAAAPRIIGNYDAQGEELEVTSSRQAAGQIGDFRAWISANVLPTTDVLSGDE